MLSGVPSNVRSIVVGAVVDPTTIALTLDGTPLSIVPNKVGDQTTIVYVANPPLAAGTHNLGVFLKQVNGTALSGNFPFGVAPYLNIPASYAAGTHVDPATDTAGFKVRIHQLPIVRFGYPGGDPNSNRSMEHELADGYIDPTT